MLDLIILTGEASGDLLGEKLIASLLSVNPSLKIEAVAGPLMRKHPIHTIFPMEKLQVMGFLDVLFHLSRLTRLFFRLRREILTKNPKAVICIDYPGLHLRLQKSLRKKGYQGRLIHYVCPSVWAWKKSRIQLMEKQLDLLLTLFPFEKPFLEKSTLRVDYVGHPLIDAIEESTAPREKLIALFPGSRTAEIKKNLPLQVRVAQKLQREDPALQIAVSAASATHEQLIHTLIPEGIEIVSAGNHYPLMQKATLAFATSGTVTLELALHKTPTVVHYVMSRFEEFLAQKIFGIHLPFYSIVNILAGKEIFPEFFGSRFTEEALFKKGKELLLHSDSCQRLCQEIKEAFGTENASQKAARSILACL